jgi:hypothetical protein
MNDFLRIDCDEWRRLSDEFPFEMQVIMEMMIDAEEELCEEQALH